MVGVVDGEAAEASAAGAFWAAGWDGESRCSVEVALLGRRDIGMQASKRAPPPPPYPGTGLWSSPPWSNPPPLRLEASAPGPGGAGGAGRPRAAPSATACRQCNSTRRPSRRCSARCLAAENRCASCPPCARRAACGYQVICMQEVPCHIQVPCHIFSVYLFSENRQTLCGRRK